MKLFLRIPAVDTIHPELSRWLMWLERTQSVKVEIVSADGPEGDWGWLETTTLIDAEIYSNNIGIDRARNAICHQFLASDCTHVWMIDHDIVPVRKIPHSAERHACWSGIYDHLMGTELCKSIWQRRRERPVPRDAYIPCGIGQDYDAVSGGCMILSRELLEKIPYPWFQTHFNADGTISKGEDFDFCEKVIEAGEKIYLDPTYYCHHMKCSSLKIIASIERRKGIR